jgi:hypothetical protein
VEGLFQENNIDKSGRNNLISRNQLKEPKKTTKKPVAPQEDNWLLKTGSRA